MAVVALCLTATTRRAEAGDRSQYRLQASVSLRSPQIDGSVEVSVVNHSRRTLTDVVFLLFPNRFATPDAGINDFNRPFVYPRQAFDPGRIEVLGAYDAERVAAVEIEERAGLPSNGVARVTIAPLLPGGVRVLKLRFRTTVPHRFGPFGIFEDQLTLVGGWYPYVAALAPDGTWQVNEPPPLASFDVRLSGDLELVLNGRHFAPGTTADAKVDEVHYLSLIAAPRLLSVDTTAGATHIELFPRPQRRTSRIGAGPPAERVLETLRAVVEAPPPPGMGPPPADLVVVQAPLRLHLTAAGEGDVILSDRALALHWLLQPFHELQIAQAVYEEWLRPSLAAREPSADYPWVSEGLARILADRFLAQARPGTRSVQDWIELFNIFAIVDRFETAPKIPFVAAFFERSRQADALHEQITTFNRDLPPGHVILGKLRQLVGDATFHTVIDRCLVSREPFRQCAARESGRDLDWFFAQWLQPYPDVNYNLGPIHLNASRGDSFVSDVTVRRHANRHIREPVDVQLRSIGGQPVTLRWDGEGDEGHLTAVTPRRMCQVVVDPDRKLIETTRADNARPPLPQIVLDTAEVEISSTEFGFSGLVVGRGRYDYRKDLAVAAFYTNRSIGVDAGARYHWGEQNDPTLYRHNVYAFYGVQALDRSFKDSRRPNDRTTGHTNGLGVRYDYNTIFAYDNPTEAVHLQLYTDWYDRALGSDFDYVDWGGSFVATHPLWTHRTILAGEITNGFSEALGSSRVPNQGLFSLGGSRSIRGIGAEDELGRNIFLLRGEVRQTIYPELDLNFLDLLVLRRTQARLFVDTGQVGNSAGAVYDPSGYAVGAGIGLGAVYDFMGFFPSLAYIEIATRVDRASDIGDVQFLFGTRQPF